MDKTKGANFGISIWECRTDRQYWNQAVHLGDFLLVQVRVGMEDLKQVTDSAGLNKIN